MPACRAAWSAGRRMPISPRLLVAALSRLAAGGDHAHLRVRRSAVFLVPALALVRSRRLVRERVPALLRRTASPRRRASTRRSSSARPKRAGASTSARSAARCCGRRSTRSATSWRACLHAVGRDVAVDGYSQAVRAAVSYASACYGLLALLASVAIVRRLGRWWPGAGRRGRALGAGRLAGHAAALLHVHRAADVARDVGLRRGGVFILAWLTRPRHVEHAAGWPCSARSPP